MFSSSELDRLVKDSYKVFEIFSFLDSMLEALMNKIEDCSLL